jgi:hypothetical protein
LFEHEVIVSVCFLNGGHFFGLKGPSDDPKSVDTKGKVDVEEEISDKEPDDDEHILCGQCLNQITQPSQKTEIAGAHRHSFANPHGIVFDIGCFKSAGGCKYVGPATDEFTWFVGYRWRVSVCAACLVHLGWLFVSSSEQGFFGLILNRLIFPKSN